MAPPEPSDAWVTVAEVLGIAIAAGASFWWKNYKSGHAEEKDPREISVKAVGAGLISQAAGDAIVGMSGVLDRIAKDIEVIRTVAEGVVNRANKEDVLREARRISREEIDRVERERADRERERERDR